MFLDENTPDLRTIRRRYSELGISDFLFDDGDIIIRPPELIQDINEDIRFGFLMPAGGEDDETLGWTHNNRRRPVVQPRRNNAAVGTDDLVREAVRIRAAAATVTDATNSVASGIEFENRDRDDGVTNDENNGQEVVIDEGVVALEPEHYAAGDMYDDYNGDYDYDDYEDDDEDDRYTIDTFDLLDYNLHQSNYADDSIFLQFYPRDGDIFDDDDDDDDDNDDNDNDGDDAVVNENEEEREGESNSSQPWLVNNTTSPLWQENWESDESLADAVVTEPERVPLPNSDHEGLVLRQHSQQVVDLDEEQEEVVVEEEEEAEEEHEEKEEETTIGTRSVSGGADWPVAELSEDSERSIRLWSSVIDCNESELESDLYDA